jgi:PAS domain S-box-containing protein
LKNHLATVSFEERLQWQLDDASRALRAVWLGVAEIGFEQSPFAPRWLAASDGQPPAWVPELEQFESLVVQGPPHAIPLDGSVTNPGGGGAPSFIVALDVHPRLLAHVDACLVIVAAVAPDASTLAELRGILEQGLSEWRTARMARTVLAAVEQAADPIELSDPEGRLFFINGAWQRFTGYRPDQALGATAGQLFRDPESSPHDPHFYRFAMAELHAGRPFLGALSGRVEGGRQVFAEAHVAPFQLGKLKAHIAIRRDLSDRSQRDLALLAAHREFRGVLAAITDGVCVLRGELVYFTNAAFARILGVEEAGLSGRRFLELIHPEDREHFERGHRTDVSRVRAVRAGGSARFVEISSAGEVSFEGHAATILLVRDTTDYQLAQEELSRAEKLSALGSLAAGVAHELNNPLAYVALNLDLLDRRGHKALGPPEREALTEAIEGVARMRQIAGELHTFSGRDEPGPPGPVDLSRAVTSALNLVNNAIRQRAVLIRELTPGLFALGREGQLVQVFVNLLVNAAHAIPTPSEREHTIVVRTQPGALGGVEVVVRDTGVGVPEQLLPILFAPFSTSKKRGEGSGLGLAICKRIIDELGGAIHVQSALGQGTTVTISLLAAPATPSATQTPTSARAQLPRLRILVVEDELPIARALQRLLEGHEVTRAAHGKAALALLTSHASYDCILCDLMIPGLSGAEVYREAVARWPSLTNRFVFMTGGAVTPDCREFLDAFTGDVLWKPFTTEAVHQAVARVRRNAGPLRDSGTRIVQAVPVVDRSNTGEGTE